MKRTSFAALALTIVALLCTSAPAQQPLEYNVTVYGGIVKGSPADHYLP